MPSSISAEKRIGLLDDDEAHASSSASSSLLGNDARKDLEASSEELVGSDQRWDKRLFSWCLARPRGLRRKLRRGPAGLALAFFKYIIIIICILLIGTPIFAPSYTRLPQHYRDLESRCRGPIREAGCANINNEKIFIAVSLYDKEGHLVNGFWGESLLELIHLLGDNNVFLSIYENDSGPEGAAALESLRRQLRCKNYIVNDPHVPLSDFPTVTLPDETKRVKRLAYLSEMRNRALRPLDRFDPSVGTVRYDKILFLNDVVFHAMEAAHLLFSTNVESDGRSHYLSACAVDFWTPLKFYDLYVTRDYEGYSAGLPFFPVFLDAGEGVSRTAILNQEDAVPVQACWSGMVAMQAKYVQNMNETLPNSHFQDISSYVIDPAKPHNVTAPVRFRYEPELFFDACECCLFHADVAQVARKAGEKELGIYMNPYVRVAYTENTLSWLPLVRRFERLFSIPHALSSHILSLPTRNPHRTVQEGDIFTEEIWVGEGNTGHWQLVQREGRNGMFCGVREMQAIKLDERDEDKNWENIKIPAGQVMHFPT
ncbi:glycosyltransferase family 69 protein [Daldinia loculata]|uniref:glycosyltransferase family 69 protein n=1 Tax=Daldinia loculata TaxID=103429 RepID=UPI0020C42C19|nr:glycosyltransferase family 69 protein [Daldinia loculata]KAI1649334.1 glycosyltransferase family 69 protein [Daldinia loculata]